MLEPSWLRGFGGRFGWILGSKMEPSWDQNGIPNRFLYWKSRKAKKLWKTNGFSMIWGGFQGCQNRWKTQKNRLKSRHGGGLDGFWLPKRVLRGVRGDCEPVQNCFYTILAANIGPPWDPRWHQVGPQIVQKSMSKSMKKLKPLEIRFWGRFGRIFGSKMEPSWDQNGIPNRSYIEKAEKQINL